MIENVIVEVSDRVIDLVEARAIVTEEAGALVTFVGTVRDRTDGRKVARLEYEAYSSMAEAVLKEIGERAAAKWNIGKVALIHRVGVLEVGEVSVLVSVGAPHRGDAFDACEYCIDTLKANVPIWKKEVFIDGDSHWVNHP